jgi:erythromycin esterase-like protein
MATERKTFDIGRNAKSGQFTTVKEAERKSASHIVERMPKKGYGDS